MPKRCKICESQQRDAVDRLIVAGRSIRAIASQFGFSKSRVHVHTRHLGEMARRVHEAGLDQEAAGRVKALRRDGLDLLKRAQAALDQAEAEQNWSARLGAMRELRGILAVLGKLFGQIGIESKTTNVLNVHLDGETAARMAQTFLERRKERGLPSAAQS